MLFFLSRSSSASTAQNRFFLYFQIGNLFFSPHSTASADSLIAHDSTTPQTGVVARHFVLNLLTPLQSISNTLKREPKNKRATPGRFFFFFPNLPFLDPITPPYLTPPPASFSFFSQPLPPTFDLLPPLLLQPYLAVCTMSHARINVCIWENGIGN